MGWRDWVGPFSDDGLETPNAKLPSKHMDQTLRALLLMAFFLSDPNFLNNNDETTTIRRRPSAFAENYGCMPEVGWLDYDSERVCLGTNEAECTSAKDDLCNWMCTTQGTLGITYEDNLNDLWCPGQIVTWYDKSKMATMPYSIHT